MGGALPDPLLAALSRGTNNKDTPARNLKRKIKIGLKSIPLLRRSVIISNFHPFKKSKWLVGPALRQFLIVCLCSNLLTNLPTRRNPPIRPAMPARVRRRTRPGQMGRRREIILKWKKGAFKSGVLSGSQQSYSF